LIFILSITAGACKKSTCTTAEQDAFPYKCELGMDVVFLIDYTGSMGGAIDNIKTNVASIVSNIITKSGGDYRLGLSIFDEFSKAAVPPYNSLAAYTGLPAANKNIITTGSTTNQYLTVLEKFTTANNVTFGTQLAVLNTPAFPLGFGVGTPEPGGLLLDKIVTSSFAGIFRPFKTKLAIIITDAPDGGNDDNASATDDTFLAALATACNTQGIQCILVTSLASSNYSVQLIGNNTGGLKLMSANFANISTNINTMINNLCENNSK
jgi:hypothetical protein